jgi:hypothetical protein
VSNSDNQTKTPGESPRPTPQELAQWRNDRDWQSLFRALHPSWSVTIERLKPSWCMGWLDTVECDPEEPFSHEYIRDTWGGQRFKLTINDELGQYITRFRISIDGPPKRNGRILEDPEQRERRERREEREAELERMQLSRLNSQPTTDPTLGNIVAKLIETQSNTKGGDLDFFREILKSQLKKEPESRRDLKEMLELAKSMREMADMFGMGANDGGGDVWGGAAAKFLDVLDRKNQIDAAKAAPLPPKAAKRLRVIKNPGAVPQQSVPVVDQTAQPGNAELDRTALAATLAGMSPMDAAAVTMSALSQMPPENRYQLMEMLGGGELDEYEDGEDLEDREDREEKSQNDGNTVLEHGKPNEGSEAI